MKNTGPAILQSVFETFPLIAGSTIENRFAKATNPVTTQVITIVLNLF